MKPLFFKLFLIWGNLLIFINLYSQNEVVGTFSYINEESEEIIITLNQNYTFWYCKGCSIKRSVGDCTGYWNIKEDSILVLNSDNSSRIIVFEDNNKKNKKNSTIIVFPSNFPNETHIIYNMYIVTEEGDTLSLYNQVEKIIIRKKIKSFWIEDVETKLKSHSYRVQSDANIFNVFFDKGRVFDNEEWLIVNNEKLRARGLNGELQDYYLDRKN